VLGRADLLEAAGPHDGDPIGEGQGLGLIVGDEHRTEPEPGVELVQLRPDEIPQAGVEVAQRFVEQHDVGPGDESTGEGDPLLLPTAELRRVPIEQLRAVDQLGGLLDPVLGVGTPELARLQRVADVLAHGHVRPQGVGLEHHADVPLVRAEVELLRRVEHVAVAEGDAPLVGCLQAGHAAQRGGLAAAARAEQDEELALLDLEVQVVHRRRRRLSGEALGQPLDAQLGHNWSLTFPPLGL
jgi:hypothetical protein